MATVVVRFKGRFVRVRVGPYESEERAMSRAWWVAHHALDKGVDERECLSMMWANATYDKMKYDLVME